VNAVAAGALIHGVMQELGYQRYLAQGGDWGAIVTSRMAETYPDSIAALHLNMAPGGPANPFEPVTGLTGKNAEDWAKFLQFMQLDGGYSHLQATRPQTVAVGINDSPAGLAAWIIDKFWSWTDHGGDLNSVFDFDHLLDNLSLYWFTETAGSSFRLYMENLTLNSYRHATVRVPTGVLQFAGEPFRWPRPFVEQNYHNLVDWVDRPGGGHFAAFQRPKEFLDAVRGFFRNQSI
jgi:microsomal epoxide hydrolase